ncbi:MAG: hypothetical protein WCS94_13500, partial [Verrucomicrobiota bacterium]
MPLLAIMRCIAGSSNFSYWIYYAYQAQSILSPGETTTDRPTKADSLFVGHFRGPHDFVIGGGV